MAMESSVLVQPKRPDWHKHEQMQQQHHSKSKFLLRIYSHENLFILAGSATQTWVSSSVVDYLGGQVWSGWHFLPALTLLFCLPAQTTFDCIPMGF